MIRARKLLGGIALCALAGLWITGCEAPAPYADTLPEAQIDSYNYIVGPGDNLGIFVWRNPELSQTVQVRPDGKVSAPLVVTPRQNW